MKASNFKTRTKLMIACGTLMIVSLVITLFGWKGFYQMNQIGTRVVSMHEIQNRFSQIRLNFRTFIQTKDQLTFDKADKNLDTCISMTTDLRDNINLRSVHDQADSCLRYMNDFNNQLDTVSSAIKNQLSAVANLRVLAIQMESGITTRNADLNENFLRMRILLLNYMLYQKDSLISDVLGYNDAGYRIAKAHKLEETAQEFLQYKDLFLKYANATRLVNSATNEQLMISRGVNKWSREAISGINNYMENQAKSSAFLMALLAVFALVFGILVTMSISNYFVKNLEKGVNLALAYSEGDFSHTISKKDMEMKDELGDLTRALVTMSDKLRSLGEVIQQHAQGIAATGRQLAATSGQLSEGANQQASSVEEISSSMEEMVSNTQQNADNAKQTETIAQQTSALIGQVSEASERSLESVRIITERISIINDIAFQTNLLALNAAVEAARAGEQGRGFAVVATEVRKLAENSKKAADEVVVMAMESKKLTDNAVVLMKKMDPEVEKTSGLIREIAAASIEQLNGADQINNAIQQLNQLTQASAAAAEQLASSAEKMNSQSENLLDTMSFFKFGKNS